MYENRGGSGKLSQIRDHLQLMWQIVVSKPQHRASADRAKSKRVELAATGHGHASNAWALAGLAVFVAALATPTYAATPLIWPYGSIASTSAQGTSYCSIEPGASTLAISSTGNGFLLTLPQVYYTPDNITDGFSFDGLLQASMLGKKNGKIRFDYVISNGGGAPPSITFSGLTMKYDETAGLLVLSMNINIGGCIMPLMATYRQPI